MKKPKFNKKIIIPILVGVVLAIGFFALLNVARVNAEDTKTGSSGGLLGNAASAVATWFFRLLGNILATLGSLILNTAMKFFEYTLTMGFNGHSEIAQIGWKVSRDIANMFFILFMVVIAFATILRFERYGAKDLLPKIIIIALLINFSMVLCYVLIDITNIAANFFVTNATNGNRTPLSQIFLDGLQVPRTFTAALCDQYLIKRDDCSNLSGGDPMDIPVCQYNAQHEYEQCVLEMNEIQKTATADEDLMHVIVAQIGSAIVIFIAAFVILAGAILLVIRSIAIWFLVILSPLAFICFILPALKGNWDRWMTQFTRWCIFAPAYAFFIWLAAKICTEERMERIAMIQGGTFADRTAMVNQFFSDPVYFFGFIFIAGFLIAALITANKLGIYGANMAMNVGKRWTGTVTGWAKKGAMAPVKGVQKGAKAIGERAGAGTETVRGGIMTRMGRMFGGKIGGRMEARGAQMKQAAAERAYNKKYDAMLKTASNETVLREVKEAKGSRALIAAQRAQNRGLLREADRETVKAALKTYKSYGATETARQLEELRPSAVENKEERTAAIERAISKGTHKNWGKKEFEGVEGAGVAEELREQLGTGEFVKVFKGWAKDIREEAEKALTAGFDKDMTDAKNIEKRKAFAAVTGKVNTAFFSDSTGARTLTSDPLALDEAIKHIKSLKDEGFGDLKADEDKDFAAIHMEASQVQGAGAKLSGADKKRMKLAAQNVNPKAYAAMDADPGWKT